ncbi:YolD-like family protein [Gracilibacillus kekensis]|uniref:YolD-like protein n=1 Tax=Gracilibacillus kekensis TaxID=1027249 RepID=A0A1M7PNG1_9BACI|nr:YolD-like family protein [Gracilibacillus kekensis]SHN18855.1 YolD-like protein [Gracilibacillus kekensis]
MVHDRGKIKWASLMLPEHVTMLQELFEEERPVEKPILSEDYLLEMEYSLQKAIRVKQKIKIEYHSAGKLKAFFGKIDKIKNNQTSVIRLYNEQEHRVIQLKDVVAVEILNDQ